MAHKLERFSKSIFNSPQFITQEKYREIAAFLDNRNSENFLLPETDFESKDEKPSIENGVGILPVQGVISAKRSPFEALCEMTSYPKLIESMDYFVEQGVKIVFMDLDSGGGSAHLCMETSRNLRKKADDNGIKLIGYVNGSSGSAAMALASVCHELYANGTSKCGSIGCVVSLLDDSEAMKQEGLKRIFITSTNGKVPFDEEGKFKQHFLDDVKDDVIALHNTFVTHVNQFRGIPEDKINAMQSKMFRAELALEEGLIDGVMEVEEFYDYLASLANEEVKWNKSKSKEQQSTVVENLKTQEEVIEMADTNTATPEMLAEIEAMKAQLAEMTAQNAAFKAEKELAEKTSLAEKLEAQAPFLSNKESIVEQLMSGNDAQKELLNTMINDCASMVDSVKAEALAQVEEVQAKAQEDIAQAQADAEQAKKEAENVKSEFGKQETVEDEPADKEVTVQANSGRARTAQLEMAVAQALKNK